MTFEQDLLKKLDAPIKAGAIVVATSSEEYFNKLASFFPTCGSKVDWSNVPGAVGITVGPQEYVEDSLAFFEGMREAFQLNGQCVVMSDNGFECALIMRTEILSSVLRDVLDIPQHHYVVAVDYSWCIAFTTEGYVDFGCRPTRTHLINEGQNGLC